METATHSQFIETIRPWCGDRSPHEIVDEYEDLGFVTFENVLTPEDLDRVRSALAPHLAADIRGRQDFEGLKSNRIYAMLAKGDIFSEIVAHPLTLAFAEAELGTSCLLKDFPAINLRPGETVQPWHHDDSQLEYPLPHFPFSVSTFWAISATTVENGATELIPGSHHWTEADGAAIVDSETFERTEIGEVDDDPFHRPDAVSAEMTPGSVTIAKGTVWHRGGANRSDDDRLIVTPQYCRGWIRPAENQISATPLDVTRQLPQRVRALMGYSIHGFFLGHVGGRHPERVLSGPAR